MLDSAESDLSPFRRIEIDERRRSVIFSVEIIEDAVSRGDIRPLMAVSMLADLSGRAARLGEVGFPSDEIRPDVVARRALAVMPLSLEGARAAADRRRTEAIANKDAFYSPAALSSESPLPPDEGIDELVEIEHMLHALEPISGLVVDETVSANIRPWLSALPHFNLGWSGPEV